MTMRIGGRQPRPGEGRRLYETLAQALEPLDVGQQLAVGGALIERQGWETLDPWVRELFEAAAVRFGNG